MRVYVSSTFTDLAEHRAAVKRVIESLKDTSLEDDQETENPFEYAGLEYLSADPQPSLETRLQELTRSDLFVLLIGWRYGYVPEGQQESVVELEYQTAVENKLPVLCYIIDDNYPVPVKFVDTGESAEKLKRFKDNLRQEKIVRYFNSPEDLAQKVTADLSFNYNRVMKTKFSDITRELFAKPLLEQELQRYKQDNATYSATINSLRNRLENIVPAEPIWSTRNFKIDTTFCFTLMPFQDSFFSIYEDAILPALNNAGLRGMHAGEIFDNREIVEDIWESICTARLIIADVTGRNPNVFYELGICHTLGKEVIVITQSGADVPFDIRHRRFIDYEANKLASLKTRLEKTVKQVILRSQIKKI